jgi:hypothetical protein
MQTRLVWSGLGPYHRELVGFYERDFDEGQHSGQSKMIENGEKFISDYKV